MIKANELRIGNCVYFDTRLDKITSLGQTLVVAEMHSHYYYERIHPVPLTPELLEKCGFARNEDGFRSHRFFSCELPGGIGEIHISPDNGVVWLFKADNQLNPVKVQYFHQLQNLYFALTGEELTVKL